MADLGSADDAPPKAGEPQSRRGTPLSTGRRRGTGPNGATGHSMWSRPRRLLGPDARRERASGFGDEDFAEDGLAEPRITDPRNWVTGWYDDLSGRLAADLAGDETSDDP